MNQEHVWLSTGNCTYNLTFTLTTEDNKTADQTRESWKFEKGISTQFIQIRRWPSVAADSGAER